MNTVAAGTRPHIPTEAAVESAAATLRVLMIHNRYQQLGGEDTVFDAESALLRQHGHEVALYERDNDEIPVIGAWRTARDTFWSSQTTRDFAAIVDDFRPQIVHVHNTLPLISPSVYWAAKRAGIPVVQTLHNWRLLCPEGFLHRDGASCEDCVGRLPWRAVMHGCYRGSRAASAVLAGMLTAHRLAGTYQRQVARYIALTEYAKEKFIEGGLPADRIAVKPNFIENPERPGSQPRSGGLFVGRLTAAKGITLLLDAQAAIRRNSMRIIGSGDLQDAVAATFGAQWLGPQPQAEVLRVMRSAAYLVVPSVGQEGFPRIIAEAYSCGLPVIASRLGPLPQIVADGRTGLLFQPGDAADLGRAIAWADNNPEAIANMGKTARAEFENHYSPERNYEQLTDIYAQARQLRPAAGTLEPIRMAGAGSRS